VLPDGDPRLFTANETNNIVTPRMYNDFNVGLDHKDIHRIRQFERVYNT